jgi:hypothetical protein
MTETINGLHSCKLGNEPKAGEIKTFVVENRTGKSGKPYLKIKSATAEYGGQAYRIISAKPTGFTDQHQNISFNLEIEAINGAQPPPQAPQNAPQSSVPRPNGGGRVSMLDERQRAIIRQHSQSMALEVLKLKVTLNELTVEDLTPAKLHQLADYFDNDVLGASQ